ncbi:MAG TPA: DUF885 domain-containing protein [Longimicrobium sp.]|nr:DUF885 domain-containing protein [Longimicrobium sp.]
MRIRPSLVFLALLAGCAPAPARIPAPVATPVDARPAAGPAQAGYDRFAREFLDWYYAGLPVRSTGLGIHTWDGKLPDVSRAGMETRIRELHGWLDRLQRIDRARLAGDAALDWIILDHAIRAELLDLEEVRGWRKDPAYYSSLVANGVASISSRTFAPVGERMRRIMERLEATPAVLAAARQNLDDPSLVPGLWARDAVGSVRGTMSFLREDLFAQLRAQGMDSVDAELRKDFEARVGDAIRQLAAYEAFIEVSIVPHATGDFRLGKDVFERKLRYEEHVELTAEQLRDLNERAIRDYHAWVAREAARIDPRRTPVAVMDSITRIHPTPGELIPTARRDLDEVKRFIVERRIVTLPSDRMPVVRQTPEYARGSFASMDTPGPFERVATEAYFNITNVDPAWTAEQQDQHLTYFNYPGLLGITVHEAMPGHFVQLLYQSQIPTEVRKVFAPASLVEGWAHYAEQMMVDEGLGGGDPAVRLGQLRRALQRHARWNAGLSMHAFGASIEEASRRFEEIAYFAPFPALRETQRGTSDPTYLYYALGRMQILKLRDDYKRYLESRGERFDLRQFHDTFLRLGLPVSLARQVMIPGDTAPSL